jgi:PIN domain nuclease of toxin-antitoxin system
MSTAYELHERSRRHDDHDESNPLPTAAVTIHGLGVWELTRPVVLHSCSLPQPFHGDPADQILVATARHHGAVLLTKDQRIRRYAHVHSLW